jgi:hypothetical protein
VDSFLENNPMQSRIEVFQYRNCVKWDWDPAVRVAKNEFRRRCIVNMTAVAVVEAQAAMACAK